MGNEKYSISYYARGTLNIGIVLLTSGMVLIITGALMAAAHEAGSQGLIRHWFLFMLAGFVAVVPGVLFLIISRRLGKM